MSQSAVCGGTAAQLTLSMIGAAIYPVPPACEVVKACPTIGWITRHVKIVQHVVSPNNYAAGKAMQRVAGAAKSWPGGAAPPAGGGAAGGMAIAHSVGEGLPLV